MPPRDLRKQILLTFGSLDPTLRGLSSHAAASSDDVDEPLLPVLPTHNGPSLSYPTQEREEASSHPQVLPWARHLKPCGADCHRCASSSDSSCRSHLLAATTATAAAATTTTNVVAATAATTSAASVAAAAATYCASTRLSGGS